MIWPFKKSETPPTRSIIQIIDPRVSETESNEVWRIKCYRDWAKASNHLFICTEIAEGDWKQVFITEFLTSFENDWLVMKVANFRQKQQRELIEKLKDRFDPIVANGNPTVAVICKHTKENAIALYKIYRSDPAWFEWTFATVSNQHLDALKNNLSSERFLSLDELDYGKLPVLYLDIMDYILFLDCDMNIMWIRCFNPEQFDKFVTLAMVENAKLPDHTQD